MNKAEISAALSDRGLSGLSLDEAHEDENPLIIPLGEREKQLIWMINFFHYSLF